MAQVPPEVGIWAVSKLSLDIILSSLGCKVVYPSPYWSFLVSRAHLSSAPGFCSWILYSLLCPEPAPFVFLGSSACKVQTDTQKMGSCLQEVLAVTGCAKLGDRERLHLEPAAGGICHHLLRSCHYCSHHGNYWPRELGPAEG